MSPMTTEEEKRLREAEDKLTRQEEQYKNIGKQMGELSERIGNMEKWKDKALLLFIAILLTGVFNLAIAVFTLLAKR